MNNNRKNINLFGLLFLLFAIGSCFGCQYGSTRGLNGQENGMLWEISGNDLRQKSYLFGTMHGDGHAYTQKEIFKAFPQLKNVLDTVSCLYIEQNKNFEDSAVIADCVASATVFAKAHAENDKNVLPQGDRYSDLYGKEELDILDDFFKKELHLQSYMRFKPAYWVERLRGMNATKSDKTISVDNCLYRYALQKNRVVLGLETYTELAKSIIETMKDTLEYHKTLKEQAVDLYQLILQVKNTPAKSPCYEMYLSGDLEKVYNQNLSLVPQGVDYSKIGKERNLRWLKTIEGKIQQESCLVAVGVMHLPGKEGLIALLRDKGYIVEVVK